MGEELVASDRNKSQMSHHSYLAQLGYWYCLHFLPRGCLRIRGIRCAVSSYSLEQRSSRNEDEGNGNAWCLFSHSMKADGSQWPCRSTHIPVRLSRRHGILGGVGWPDPSWLWPYNTAVEYNGSGSACWYKKGSIDQHRVETAQDNTWYLLRSCLTPPGSLPW